MPDEEVVNTIIEEQVTSDEEKDVELFGGKEEGEGTSSGKSKVEEPPKKEEEPEISKEEEKGEGKEEGKEELTTKPSWSKVSEKYPNFFKEFPEVREALGREKAYNEVFPEGVEQARASVENAKDFSFFEERVMEGDAREFLTVIKDAGKTDMVKFVDNFLPALKEVNPQLHLEVVAPVLIETIQTIYQAGRRAGNENLQNAAEHIADYLFGNLKIASGEVKIPGRKKEDEEKNPEKEELQRERESFRRERLDSAVSEVDSRSIERLKNMIELPEDLTNFQIKHIINDIIQEVDNNLSKNSTHVNEVTRLWQLAEKHGFDTNSRLKIISTYVNNAKEILPEIRRKVLANAGIKQRERKESRPEPNGGSRSGGSSSRHSGRKVDWSKTSDEDLFSGKATYKD